MTELTIDQRDQLDQLRAAYKNHLKIHAELDADHRRRRERIAQASLAAMRAAGNRLESTTLARMAVHDADALIAALDGEQP